MARPLIGTGTAIIFGIIAASGAGYGDKVVGVVQTASNGLLTLTRSAAESTKSFGTDSDVANAVTRQLEKTMSEMKEFVIRETSRSQQPQSIHIVNSEPSSKLALFFKIALLGGAAFGILRVCGYGMDDLFVVTKHTLDVTATTLKDKMHTIQQGCERGFHALTSMITQYRAELTEMREKMSKALDNVKKDVNTVHGKVDEVKGTMTRMEDKVNKTHTGLRMLCGVVSEQFPASPAIQGLRAFAADCITYENSPPAIQAPVPRASICPPLPSINSTCSQHHSAITAYPPQLPSQPNAAHAADDDMEATPSKRNKKIISLK